MNPAQNTGIAHKNRVRKIPAGFTLVELIVVITILVILGTIAFLSLGGYSSSARDSQRVENLSNLHKGLSIFQIKTGTFPMPEGAIAISATTTTLGYQGFAKDQVNTLSSLSKDGTKDPSDGTIYTTYMTNASRNKMQVTNFLEDSSTITSYVPEAYADVTSDYSKRTPITKGDTIGVLLSTSTGNLNQPLQEKASGSFTGIDIASFTGTLSDGTSTNLKAVISDTQSIGGTGGELLVIESNATGKMRLVMHSCPTVSGWTEVGITPNAPSGGAVYATNDNSTFTPSKICEANNGAIIPTGYIFLAQSGSCSAGSLSDTGWRTPLAPAGSAGYCDPTGVNPCAMCKSVADAPIPAGVIALMQSCPSSWKDVGAPLSAPSAKAASCLYGQSCRLCQKL